MSKSGKIELNDYRYLTSDYTGKMLTDFIDLKQFDFAGSEVGRGHPAYFWSQERASRYIESIFNDKPLTPLIFQGVANKKGEEWKIVDGYQRLLSLYFFMKGRFPKDTEARQKADDDLVKLNTLSNIINSDKYSTDFTLILGKRSEFNGKTFKDLPRNIQMKLTTVRYIRCWSFKTDKAYIQKHDLYLELLSRYNDRSVAYGRVDVESAQIFTPLWDLQSVKVDDNSETHTAKATIDTETGEATSVIIDGEETTPEEEAITLDETILNTEIENTNNEEPETQTEAPKRRGRKPLKEKT